MERPICPKCNTELPTDAPLGVCPKCLLEQGLDETVAHVPKADNGGRLATGVRFGRYLIGEKLGSGGMGDVFIATDQQSGRRLALKVLNHKLESEEHRQRFLREGRLAASVNHQNTVYIFGTSEINGSPVIAMELAAGGTLQDRVKQDGPMSPEEAVEYVLQLIAGLEAAHTAGILHRDIKPANCFLDADGDVKVGDFGLSISKLHRSETNITETGVFLGTPAFSSPEQLRGDQLDCRSDIYSVGVTLFYLLTGKTPFYAKQMVQLLAIVLDRPAPSPTEFSPDVPAGLARVVTRCLEKRGEDRFASYDELRHALLPYSSKQTVPAKLGVRFFAYLLDTAFFTLLFALLPLLWARSFVSWVESFAAIAFGEPSAAPNSVLLGAIGVGSFCLYFTICEGIWGTTPGKSIFSLRVQRLDRDVPGLGTAALRTLLLALPIYLPIWACYAYQRYYNFSSFTEIADWFTLLSLFATLGFFLTVRRRNGFAAVHELGSGTRTREVPNHEHRPPLEVEDDDWRHTIDESEPERVIGPFHVLGKLTGGFLLTYDTQLLRRVWIRPASPETPQVTDRQRELSRIGRVRWLNGQRTESGGWDAFEAPSGRPLLELVETPQPWSAVRFWVADLAEELKAAKADDSQPSVLDLDRVWITADGRAKLLDFRVPFLPHKEGTYSNDPSPSAQCFLKRVAMSALAGRTVTAAEAAARPLEAPISPSSLEIVNQLGKGNPDELPAEQLRVLTEKPCEMSSNRRFWVMTGVLSLPVLLTLFCIVMNLSTRWALTKHPKASELAAYLAFHESLSAQEELGTAIEIVVAHRYKDLINSSSFWQTWGMDSMLTDEDKRKAKRIVTLHPEPSEEEIKEAESALEEPYVRDYISWAVRFDKEFYTERNMADAVQVLSFILILLVIPNFLILLLLGRPVFLDSLGYTIVNARGERASRFQLMWRATLLWLVICCAVTLMLVIPMIQLRIVRFLVIVTLFSGLVKAPYKDRPWHDKIAGTWIVPA